MTSLYETNVLNQLDEWKRLLKSPLPSAIYTINPTKRRIIFVGTDIAYHYRVMILLGQSI